MWNAECVLSHFSCVRLFVTPWTVALQVPLSMEFSRQVYWNRLPFSTPGDLHILKKQMGYKIIFNYVQLEKQLRKGQSLLFIWEKDVIQR